MAPLTVAVASGKGGVGKSTVALNLALALAEGGASVGVLDADVYDPDIPLMVNLTRREPVKRWEIASASKRTIEPVERFGLKIVSAGFILGEATAMGWQGGLVDVLISQFYGGVEWGDVRYLIVDLPPGTADLQQGLVKRIPLAGALVVVTPQDVAHLDAKKMVSMLTGAGVAVLGGVENMSGLACPHCAERIELFPRVADERSIWAMGVERLGEIPMDPAVAHAGDAGTPLLVSAPGSAPAAAFRALARRVVEKVLR